MDLVVDQVVQLEHVHDAHGHLLVEGLAGAAVEEHRLAAASGRPASASVSLMSRSRARRRRRGSRSGRRAAACSRAAARRRRRACSSHLAMSSSPSKISLDVLAERRSRRTSPRACTGAARPSTRAPQPRCVSRICPTFMRLGTPSGLSTMSTGRAVLRGTACPPRAGCGEMTPLLPWRPAILSPTWSLRLMAM